MITIAQAVEDLLSQDDVALAAAVRGWLNLSSYARTLLPQVEARVQKPASEASVVTALSRVASQLPAGVVVPQGVVQSLSIHSRLVGLTYERTDAVSKQIGRTYQRVRADHKTFLTVTQGINEVTIVAEVAIAHMFEADLSDARQIYLKPDLIGLTVQFEIGNLDSPNLIYALTRRLAYKNINIIEVVSTATELTFIVEKADLSLSLEQLQKEL